MAYPPPPSSTKPAFWRIQNIKTSEREVATEWLQGQVKELAISEGQGFSLAADGERTLCATLTSREQPTPSNRSWRVDKDFIGFTPLSDPEDANVDIVAVTGLGGHALGSFRSADGVSVWLRDFAPKDIPRARFVTYGYDTAVVASDNNQGVRELARTLLDGLAIFRQRTQTQQRPLLFVCHSLGGVVLKEALVMSSKVTEVKHKKLLEVAIVTYGLVFMGVPNLGLKHNQLETVVKGRRNEGFVRDLLVRSDGEASQFLTYLTDEFSDLDKRRSLPFEIVSYYETVSSPTVVESNNGHFSTDGPRELMVTKMSAERIGHHVRNIEHLSSDTDHRGLVRFEHSLDGRYMSVIEKLKEMAAEAPPALQSRARSGYFGGAIQVSQLSKPSRYLPFSQNKNFIGRTEEIDTLEQKLMVEQDCQKIAVVGLGGVGKTQVALQFAYSILEKHPDVSVFWIHALSLETFEQACREVAGELGILGAEDGKEDVKELIQRHLGAERAGRWMLIVDNADEQKGLTVETQKRALQHLSNIFPSDEHTNREIWREYIPHVARMREVKAGEHVDIRGRLCLQVGCCLRVDGRIRDAVGWLEESRDLRAGLSKDNSDRLLTQHVLAIAYQANGQVKDAVRLLEQVVAIRERVLAEDHPSRLASQHNLASAYQANGQVKDAVRLLKHVVAIQERVLAEDHPDRLTSQHNLARAYKANG